MLLPIDNQIIFLFVIGFINLIAFLIMLVDKIRANKTNSKRISEGKLFFMAILFGSVGVYLGMFTLRHKTKKWYFVIGIPLLMIQNFSTLYFIHTFLL